MSSEKNTLLHQIRSLLVYHQLLELEGYTKKNELTGFFTIKEPKQQKLSPVSFTSHNSTGADQTVQVAAVRLGGTMDEIADEVRSCSSCSLHRQRTVAVPGKGGAQAKLLIVGGWLTADSMPETGRASVLGPEEDEMLSRMLAAIHLPRERACITNVIKCGIPDTVQPKTEHINACVSYLHRQIATLSPLVICTMGIIATRALLKSSQPLSQLRGRFHQYRIDEESTVALMPTYHPTFLLKNPEMKMATWSDLQQIEKKLQN